MDIYGVDSLVLVSMVFSLVVLLVIGGFIAVIPLFRRLAKAVDVWLEQRKAIGPELRELETARTDLGELRARLEATETHLDLVAERQEFLERLLGETEGEPASGP